MSGPSDQWWTGSPRQIIGGQLAWRHIPGQFVRLGIPGANYSDFVMKADITPLDWTENYSFSFYWRMSTPGEYRIYLDQGFATWTVYFFDYQENAETEMIRVISGNIPHPNPSGENNSLTVVASGSLFAFYVNDAFLGFLEDSRSTQGDMGFTLDDNEGSEYRIAFTNIKVWNLAVR